MFLGRFSEWYALQPELIQRLVVIGPPLLASAIIGLALRGNLRPAWLTGLGEPSEANTTDADESERSWTEVAEDSIDALVAGRRRGLD